ncbi:hypothetical protein BC835DRAFT_331571 [Cytidiella melzeri]|nr:hypothetical protein BC835DRAFT_331571 [Cytidiella melzeri]
MNAFGDARQGSTAELVSRANDYEARVKAFWCRVQKALEEIHATGVVRESSLSTYRFPGRQSSDGADAVSNAVDGGLSESLAATESSGDGGVNRDDFPAQDSFTYSALGLYNLKPRIRRLGGRNNSFMQDESEIPLGAGTSSAQAPMFDEPQEFPVDDDMMKEILSASPDTLRAPSDPRLVEDLVDGRRAIMRGREPSLGEGSQTAIRTPFDIGEVAPLSLRSFPLRTRDTWDEEREAVRRMAREDLGRV